MYACVEMVEIVMYTVSKYIHQKKLFKPLKENGSMSNLSHQPKGKRRLAHRPQTLRVDPQQNEKLIYLF